MGGQQRGTFAEKEQAPHGGSGPWERCPHCKRKCHPQEMVEAITGDRVCYKCADDPGLLEAAGSGVV